MDEQISKTRRRIIVPCVSFLVSCLFVSWGVSSFSMEPGEIDTGSSQIVRAGQVCLAACAEMNDAIFE